MEHSAFFCKRTKRSRVLLRSLQKNVAFFGFFSVLCKSSLRSFPFFRKDRKRTEHSFGSHKSPKAQKKNGKGRNVPLKKEKNGTYRTEKNVVTNPAFLAALYQEKGRQKFVTNSLHIQRKNGIKIDYQINTICY